MSPLSVAERAATVELAGFAVPRVAFGALHLAGPGGWGQPADRAAAIGLVRAAVEAGVRYIDTADTLGPDVSEAMIAEALRPYRDDILIATKAGMTRTGARGYGVLGHPAYLRQQAHASALRLGLERIPLFYLHRIDPDFALEDQLGALVTLREEGVIGAIGLSAVTLAQLRAAQELTEIAAVQNHYNAVSRQSDELLDAAERDGIAFVSFWSLGRGRDLLAHPRVVELAEARRVTSAQLLIAWLLDRSPALIPLVGTADPEHLRSNLLALDIPVDEPARAALDDLAASLRAVPAFPTRTTIPTRTTQPAQKESTLP